MRSALRLPALRRHRLFESADLDETRELISRVMQPHLLFPRGRTHGRSHMDFVRVGRLGIGTIRFGGPIQVDVEAVDGYFLMMFCVAGNAEVHAPGRKIVVDDQHAVIRAPGEPFSALLSPDCEQLIMRIDPASLSGDSASMFDAEAAVSLASGPMRAWKEQLKLIASSADLLNIAAHNPAVGAHVESLLVSLLCSQDAGHHAFSSSTIAPSFVRRAEEFMAANLAAPIQLPDIARAAGVPVRTLTEGFLRFRNISPISLIRQMRLDRARQAIRESKPEVRVATIALDCGFTHFGRFAQAYRDRFGELPSETSRREQLR
ncbi:Anthranilate 1,2-dioxygenase regulatory protein [Paraburkholderia piptadeniae]|uniref:Anthranilate 1,2-dioxygenase regulatory protein n=1 Tax=Paraburkholderia piptadeniae TaxID=1701573 RepID=A0A1N7SJI8_9BURK|nr:anthranilate 1,2-dioxygenase regulatory protein AndR [Paraburkholderia piptadeniae]SIT47565.1 Anthranilate 1,2-dioxygenase regulatory protein [Paraburkholderia piptadeniae]